MMFVRRLLLPAALVLMPWFSANSWGQGLTAMQKAYGGATPAARRQFSLPNQATRPPMFPDRQGNDYTAMSPDSWGHPATRRNLPPTRFAAPSYTAPSYAAPSFAAPSYSNTPQAFEEQAVSPSQEIVLNGSPEQPVSEQLVLEQPTSEQQPEFAPLTNTGDHRVDRNESSAKDSASPSLETNSDDDQRAKVAGERYAQAENFPFDGPDASVLKNVDEVPFPFTRKEQADPVDASATSPEAPLFNSEPAVDFAQDTGVARDLRSPTGLGTQNVILPSATDSELGMYPKPRNAAPLVQSPQFQPPQQFQPAPAIAQPYAQQPTFQQQNQVFGQNQTPSGFDYPNEVTPQASQWQHPNGEANFQLNPANAQQGSTQTIPNWASLIQPTQSAALPGQPSQQTLPTFRPDLGHRDATPTVRNQPIRDDGKKFDHENKKVDYPPFKEIIATGKFFYNAEVNALRPSFLGNTGLSVDGADFSESQPFEFATTYAPQFKFGFESQYGPGVELSYFALTDNANRLGATSDGAGSVASIASVTGPGRFSTISADAAGETLTADHSFDLETFGLNFFKELKFPISRLNGKFGFMYANVAQSLLVDVSDAGGASTGGLTNTTDFRGYGPQFALEYFRPVGHTPLTLVTSFGGKGLFGRRDQFVSNDAGAVERRFGADEFITVIDFAGGVQLKKLVADGRYWTAKVGYVHQSWLGGGTAVDPQGDFGLSGFMFGVGYNR